jgi:hypothetical protein
MLYLHGNWLSSSYHDTNQSASWIETLNKENNSLSLNESGTTVPVFLKKKKFSSKVISISYDSTPAKLNWSDVNIISKPKCLKYDFSFLVFPSRFHITCFIIVTYLFSLQIIRVNVANLIHSWVQCGVIDWYREWAHPYIYIDYHSIVLCSVTLFIRIMKTWFIAYVQ